MHPPVRGLLLQNTQSREPHHLEVFLRSRGEGEHHFYCHGLSFVDFSGVFEAELERMEALIYRLPSSLLNPNYWEPHSKESENAVRSRMTGIITREEGEHTFLWRSDQVPPLRMLREGLEVDADLILGFAFRVGGEGLLQLGRASADHGERFEWASFGGLPAGDVSHDLVLAAHNDVTRMGLSQPGERMLYAAHNDHFTRVVFSERRQQRRAVSTLIRGFLYNLTGRLVPPMSDRAADQLLEVADNLGLTSWPDRDFRDKGRTFEIRAHLGKTEWGMHPQAGRETPSDDEEVLIYFDRMSGLWEVMK